MSHFEKPQYREAARKAFEIPGTHQILNETKHKVNVFRLQRFLNETGYNVGVDGNYGSETASAIEKMIAHDTTGLQVFLNELGANVEEDGVFGSQTSSALTKYLAISLGINTSISSPSLDIKKGQEFIIPAAFLNDPVMKKQLDKLKSVGIIINGDRAIIENPQALEQFNKYVEILNFLHKVPRKPTTAEIDGVANKKKVIENYVALTNTGTDYMTEELKLSLAYKYAQEIYDDIIRMGCIVERNGVTGEYAIKSIKTGKIDKNNPYNQIFSLSNTRNLIDVAMVTSMVRKNFSLNEKKIVGDASLIKSLLEQHVILDASGNRIQQARLLLLDQTHVIEQIDKKIVAVIGDDDVSAQAYQELTFLKDYISQGEVPRVNYMKNVLQQVNLYKGFLKSKATIGGDWNPDSISHASDKDFTDVVSDAIKNNRTGAIGIAIIAWLMGYKKVALGAFGLGIFGNTVANAIHATGKGAKGLLSDTDLELVKMSDVVYPLGNSNYQTGYSALAEKNKDFSIKQVDDNNQRLPYLDNKKLFDITNFLTGNEIDIVIVDNDVRNLEKLKEAITAKDPNVVFSDADLTTYIQLLKKSGIRDNGDRTLLDYFSEKQDVANRSYESLKFTGEEEFDTALNTIFANTYQNADRQERKDIIADRQRVYELLNNNWQNAPAEGTGYFDTTIGFLKQATIGAGNYSMDGLSAANKYFNWSKQLDVTRIDNVSSYLEQNNAEIKTDVVNTLTSYAAYYEARSMVEKYTGIWDSNVTDGWKILYSIIGTGGIAFDALGQKEKEYKIDLSSSIDREIGELETLKTELNSQDLNKEPFKSLITKVNTVIASLEETRKKIAEEFVLPNRLLASNTVTTYFASNNRNVVKLESEVQGHINVLDVFASSGPITISSLEKLQDSYKALSQYSTDLNGKVANHSDPSIKNIQTGILANIELFSKNDGLKERTLELVKTQLAEKTTAFANQKSALDAMSTADISSGLVALEGVNDFIGSEIQNHTLSAEILRQSSLLEKAWDTIKSAGGGVQDFASGGLDMTINGVSYSWDTVKAGLGVIVYATGTDGYFESLGSKFAQLRAAQNASTTPNQAVLAAIDTAEAELQSMAAKIQKVRDVDAENKETYKLAKDIFGDSNIGSYNVSLESLQALATQRKGEITQGVIDYLDGLSATTLTDITQRNEALSKIALIEKHFGNEPTILQKAKSRLDEIRFSTPLSQFPGLIVPAPGKNKSALESDLDSLNTKIQSTGIDVNTKTNLENLKKLLLTISGASLPDYMINGQDFTSWKGDTSKKASEFLQACLAVLSVSGDKPAFLRENLPEIKTATD